MKFAPACGFSVMVACLLAQQRHGVYGNEENRKLRQRKLQQQGHGYHQNAHNGYVGPYKDNNYVVPRPAQTEPPTERPSPRPTPSPTYRPTAHPTATPSSRPTPRPTPLPTPMPTHSPTDRPPTDRPTSFPTERQRTPGPTYYPTRHPTRNPTPSPTKEPTKHPSAAPSPAPSPEPSMEPSDIPTVYVPSENPSISHEPTDAPSESSEPSDLPSFSVEPSDSPSLSLEPTIINMGLQDRTIAAIICDEQNDLLFGNFCTLIRATGIDFFLNDFELLDGTFDDFFDFVNGPFFGNFGRRLRAGGDNNERALLSGSENNDHRSLIDSNMDPTIPGLPNMSNTTFITILDRFDSEFVENNPLHISEFEAFIKDFKKNLSSSERKFTTFAPTNDALLNLNYDVETFLNAEVKGGNDSLVLDTVLYHIIFGRVLARQDLKCGRQYKTANDEFSVTECSATTKVQIGAGNKGGTGACELDTNKLCQPNEATLIKQFGNRIVKDIEASNGIIQAVNEVILPSAFEGFAFSPTSEPTARAPTPTAPTAPSPSPTTTWMPTITFYPTITFNPTSETDQPTPAPSITWRPTVTYNPTS